MADLGGGAAAGTLDRCLVRSNRADFGGGAFLAMLNRCVLTGNVSSGGGGATDSSTNNNCLLAGNTSYEGGAAWGSTLTNCTLVGNTATSAGGGVYYSTLWNCIVYFNTATDGPNYLNPSPSFTLNYCCTTPLPTNGVGNLTNAPLFVNFASGDLHLQSGSPGINAGTNAYAAGLTDLDGNPRLIGGAVDLGAYEWDASGPLLNILHSAQGIILSWPKGDPDWKLESTPGLVSAGTSTWTLLPPPYPTNATDCVVTEPTPAGTRFYRLRKP